MNDDMPTRERILFSARKHFLAQGYQAAAIRNIASDAGFTPGALYGYFKSKEALFYALTDPLIKKIQKMLDVIETEIMAIPVKKRLSEMSGVFYTHIPELAGLIFEDREIVSLVMNGAKGTKYENFLSDLVKRNTRIIAETATRTVKENRLFDNQILTVSVEGYLAALFHLIVTGHDQDTVIRSMELFGNIFEAGMLSLLERGTLFASKQRHDGRHNTEIREGRNTNEKRHGQHPS
ncbi:MAG: TetR/AcrR family transcriptional regulator [Lachnospiraceae bacterium]|nr:TetR/AcrR family transcriptional regulator [Lachnospiraceae bacterium]